MVRARDRPLLEGAFDPQESSVVWWPTGILAQSCYTGAVITGRRTFEAANGWGGDHHGGVPITSSAATLHPPGQANGLP